MDQIRCVWPPPTPISPPHLLNPSLPFTLKWFTLHVLSWASYATEVEQKINCRSLTAVHFSSQGSWPCFLRSLNWKSMNCGCELPPLDPRIVFFGNFKPWVKSNLHCEKFSSLRNLAFRGDLLQLSHACNSLKSALCTHMLIYAN